MNQRLNVVHKAPNIIWFLTEKVGQPLVQSMKVKFHYFLNN